ncbi:MAG: hypothetical protein PHP03_00365 [Candidatus Pacebacteria bacterium]|nr:hypothetical protein [Candidatus Paceibacterota bacterium]
MEISPEQLNSFKIIYKEEYGEDLSDEEASEMAGNLLDFLLLISRPIPEGREPLDGPEADF